MSAAKKGITTHKDNLTALKRIEGQVKGVQRMIENGEYCVDIVVQLHAIVHALYSVSEKVFAKHIDGCVSAAFDHGSAKDKQAKLDEIVKVIRMLHKFH